MTNRTIVKYISLLNKNKFSRVIFKRSLSPSVDLAKVWIHLPKPSNNIALNDGPGDFYFIKNEAGFYVGAVYDMISDLHWLILPKYRGKGYLTKALTEMILPHLFRDREEQRITIDGGLIGHKMFEASEKVALAVGFIKTQQTYGVVEYLLKAEKYESFSIVEGIGTGITEKRMNEIKKQFNFLSRSLWMLQTEVEMQLNGEDAEMYAEDLKLVVENVHKQTWRFEDVWWESNRIKRE